MCHSPAVSRASFVVSRLSSLALDASGHNDKAPICCGDVGLSLSELIPHCGFPFVRYARSRFTFDTSLFYTCDRYEAPSVLGRNVLEMR